MSRTYSTQKDLLLNTLLNYYNKDDNLERILPIIDGEATLSLRIIEWFVINYAKKNFTIIKNKHQQRFKVYNNYRLKLKAYSRKCFDPFCRGERIVIPYKSGVQIQTTLGQLNFFKWILENDILDYIRNNFDIIQNDMNQRSSSAKKRSLKNEQNGNEKNNKTRKKREELSVSAVKSIKREYVEVVVKFN